LNNNLPALKEQKKNSANKSTKYEKVLTILNRGFNWLICAENKFQKHSANLTYGCQCPDSHATSIDM
jgi:hypothetical protein